MLYIQIITSLIFLLGFSKAELECGPNEVVDDCPVDCPRDYCPKDENQDKIPCPKPKECAKPQCKCGFNSRRAENGSCISTRDCPPFNCSRPNEVYNPCPSYCPSGNCSDATPTGLCHNGIGRILIVVNCSPQCRCIKNYWKEDGVCVPYEECSNIKNAQTTTTTPAPTDDSDSDDQDEDCSNDDYY